ncbi:16100_t:CDS:2, partial [Entrophospora sp. SA101]
KGERYRDEKGRLIQYRVGDYMEYPEFAKELNKEIDINYYLESTLGLCARVSSIYADSGDIKALATMGIVPIPPIGIWEFDSIKEDTLFSGCVR